MARDQEPMTDDEIEEARDGIAEAFDEARGDADATLDEEPVPDGGE